MSQARAWTNFAALGVAALLGGPGGIALFAGLTLPIDRILDALFATADARRKAKCRELCKCVGDLMARRAHAFPPSKLESARASAADILKAHGLTDAHFAALSLDANKATDEVLRRAALPDHVKIDTGDLIRELLVCFYDSLPENKDLFSDFLPAIHKESLKRLERIEDKQDKFGQTQDEQSAKIDRLLAIAEAGGVFARAAGSGITEAAVRAIVERLGGEAIGRDQLVPWLDNWIEAARRELGRRTNEGEAFEAARREAERRFRQGRLADASAAFMDALAEEEGEELERQEERKRRRLRLLEEAVRFDELAFDGEAAAEKLRRMAAIEGIDRPDALGRWLFDKAGEFYERGQGKGENGALLVAIDTYRAALLERTRELVPLDWAGTQNNLGNALRALGGREAGTGRLEEAVAAYRAALLEYTQERVPLDWAATQNNLGAALQRLGEREAGTERLEEAVAAYRAALLERTRELVPLDWAGTQNNLGNALRALGGREAGTGRLEEAVAAFRAALLEYTQERVPLDWATTQNNLGAALRALGEREADTGRLEEAVAAYRAALLEYTQERVPLDWATTQNNLGNALQALGEREAGTGRLEEAVAAYRAALLERTRERVPLDWAATQNNLGAALQRLGEREAGTERLEEAVAAYRAALLEYTQERVPLDWATIQNNLGAALRALGEREADTGRLEEAVAAYRAALLERTRERVPLDWAATQNNLGNVLTGLGKRQADAALVRGAIYGLEQVVEVFEDASHAPYAAMARANLNMAREILGRLGDEG